MSNKNEISSRRDIGTLIPRYIEDYISQDHPARFIDKFVDSLDLEEMGFVGRKSQVGRPNYSSSVMLKVWLYAFYSNITYTRKIELACHELFPMQFLTGGKCPDHNTIWRFFNKNRHALEEVFKSSVKLAGKLKLLGIVVMALDGTKIEADVSKKSTVHREDIEKLVDIILSQTSKKTDEIAENIKSQKNISYLLNEEFADGDTLESAIQEKLKELNETETNHLSSTDPDSRMMRFADGKTRMGYNAQAAVDSENGIIVASDVTNDESDNHQLNRMIDQAEENTDNSVKTTLADGGYFSGSEFAEAEENEREILVNVPKTSKQDWNNPSWEYHQDKFVYDENTDTYICPHGGKLTFSSYKNYKKRGYKSKVYRCRDYKDCPFKDKCTKQKKGRTLEVNPFKASIKNQIQKQQEPENRSLLRRRKCIVEPLFGTIKRGMKFRRFVSRSLEKVRTEWLMACSALNLRKIYKLSILSV